MNNEFIPYEQALALKELGFDEPCIGVYTVLNKKLFVVTPSKDESFGYLNTPLYQQAFKWFREKHGLESDIIFHTDYLKNSDKNVYEVNVQNRISDELHLITPLNGFKTYEEAELECLKKLIEIIKSK